MAEQPLHVHNGLVLDRGTQAILHGLKRGTAVSIVTCVLCRKMKWYLFLERLLYMYIYVWWLTVPGVPRKTRAMCAKLFPLSKTRSLDSSSLSPLGYTLSLNFVTYARLIGMFVELLSAEGAPICFGAKINGYRTFRPPTIQAARCGGRTGRAYRYEPKRLAYRITEGAQPTSWANRDAGVTCWGAGSVNYFVYI